MIDTTLLEYWVLCLQARRGRTVDERKSALKILRDTAARSQDPFTRHCFRFVDLKPKVTVKMEGEDGSGS